MLSGTEPHLHTSLSCGICGFFFLHNEECVGLVGEDHDPTDLQLVTDSFQFPSGPTREPVQGWNVCRLGPICPKNGAPPATAVHSDCFQLFKTQASSKEALRCLWRTASWRNPWRGVEPLLLPEPLTAGLSSIAAAAAICGVTGLGTLPYEIILQIHRHCRNAVIWRMAAALDLGYYVKSIIPSDPTNVPEANQNSRGAGDMFFTHSPSFPVSDILSWQRGSAPLLVAGQPPPYIRLVIDSRGIRKLERLVDKGETWDLERSNDCAFVIDHESEFATARIQFKGYMAQLVFPPQHSIGLRIWDTPKGLPSPLPLNPDEGAGAAFCLRSKRSCPIGRFHTIILSAITGLTFFMHGQAFIRSIHAHTVTEPVALPSPDLVAPRAHGKAWDMDQTLWIYVPIPEGDEVLEMYTIEDPSTTPFDPTVVLKMKLSGEVTIGPWRRPDVDVHLIGLQPEAIVYETNGVLGVESIGAYARTKCLRDNVGVEPHPPADNAVQLQAHYSWAPLEEVTRATVYYRGGTNFCSGIVFEYENGGCRAVGECRVGHDRRTIYEAPRKICTHVCRYQPDRRFPPNLAVEIAFDGAQHTCSAANPAEDSVWACHEMRGKLRFWSRYKESWMKLVHLG